MTATHDYALTVRTEELSVRFSGEPAIDRLDLRLAPGKIHGLLGRNGSGKSTLAATLAGFRQPDEGRVLIEGGLGRVAGRQKQRDDQVPMPAQLMHRATLQAARASR